MVRPGSRRIAVTLGLALGAAAGAGLGGLVDTGTAQRAPDSTEPRIEATHRPPLLTADEHVELRYDAFCVAGAEMEVDTPCDVEASVHARRGEAGPFRPLDVDDRPGGESGRFVAQVPAGMSGGAGGFSYFAVFRDRTTGATVTLPAAAASAPHRSRPLGRPVRVALGEHRFGSLRGRSARVARATWGRGSTSVGLEQGPQVTPTGGSSFDVTRDGVVHVLDQVHRRILRWLPESATPEQVPVGVNGTIADLAVAADGSVHVLETTAGGEGALVLRSFDARGRALSRVSLAERPAQLRLRPAGDVEVLQHPSGQWMRAGAPGRPATPAEQRASGRAGRTTADGGELVVLTLGTELRVAIVGSAGVRRAWRVTSPTPLAEVQLAEHVGSDVLVVVRVYEEARDEFVALLLGERGLVRSFSLAPADWAESAPLSRFRLVGSSLYQLGSSPDELFVDRFDLEVS